MGKPNLQKSVGFGTYLFGQVPRGLTKRRGAPGGKDAGRSGCDTPGSSNPSTRLTAPDPGARRFWARPVDQPTACRTDGRHCINRKRARWRVPLQVHRPLQRSAARYRTTAPTPAANTACPCAGRKAASAHVISLYLANWQIDACVVQTIPEAQAALAGSDGAMGSFDIAILDMKGLGSHALEFVRTV